MLSKQNHTRTAIVAGFFMATGVLAAPTVHADPHTHDMYLMCTALASNPTMAGVEAVAANWVRQQGDSDASVELGAATMLDAVTYTCPEYQGIVAAWAQWHHNHRQGATA